MDNTQMTKVLHDRIATLLANDTATLNQAADNLHVHLIGAPFAQSANLTVDDLDLASPPDAAADLDPKDVFLGPQLDNSDHVTGDVAFQLLPAASLFRWELGVDIDPGVTIHGIAVTNEADTVLFMTKQFETPISLTTTGDVVNAGDLIGRFPLSGF